MSPRRDMKSPGHILRPHGRLAARGGLRTFRAPMEDSVPQLRLQDVLVEQALSLEWGRRARETVSLVTASLVHPGVSTTQCGFGDRKDSGGEGNSKKIKPRKRAMWPQMPLPVKQVLTAGNCFAYWHIRNAERNPSPQQMHP